MAVFKVLNRVTQQMRDGKHFQEGVQILNYACDILPLQELTAFLQRQDYQTLKMVLQRLNDSRMNIDEINAVLTLMQTIASTE